MRHKTSFIIIGAAVVAGIGAWFFLGVNQSPGSASLPKGQEPAEEAGMVPELREYSTSSDLKITILKEGNGNGAEAGNTVSVHYVGTLTNGAKFDSSVDRGEPISFVLGEGRVIKGWEEGILGMKVGEKRRLIIPPNLGYGARGAGDAIPPDATLIFETEMVAIQ